MSTQPSNPEFEAKHDRSGNGTFTGMVNTAADVTIEPNQPLDTVITADVEAFLEEADRNFDSQDHITWGGVVEAAGQEDTWLIADVLGSEDPGQIEEFQNRIRTLAAHFGESNPAVDQAFFAAEPGYVGGMPILTDDEFDDQYSPLQAASGSLMWDVEEISTVKDADVNRVWRIVEGESGTLYAVAGRLAVEVNVVGYAFTDQPWTVENQQALWG